jgi:dienelactone hydrolase
MSVKLNCPECGARVPVPDHLVGKRIYCDACGTRVEVDDRTHDRYQGDSPPRRKSRTGLIVGLIVGGFLLIALVCGGVVAYFVWSFVSPTKFPDETQPYAEARKGFHTNLLVRGPSWQPWQNEVPPTDAVEVPYKSGGLNLKAWVSAPVAGGARRPAVLFLHGGFAFGADDWDMAKPFRDAGFVVMIPMLRGENGLPGNYTLFYDEVDDALAAAEVLATRPDVDPKRIFVAGHSAGGTLALLAAMTSDRFKAAASFSGSPDQVHFVRGQEELAPFDRDDPREFQMRSPLAFPKSFKCPVRAYYGSEEFGFEASSKKLAELAKAAGKDVEAISVPGEHMTAVAPAMQQAIAFFRQVSPEPVPAKAQGMQPAKPKKAK